MTHPLKQVMKISEIGLFLRSYEGNQLSFASPIEEPNSLVSRDGQSLTTKGKSTAILVSYRPEETFQSAGLSLELSIAGWSRDHFLLLPGAAYNANRFEAHKLGYVPLLELSQVADLSGPVMSDVMRFSKTANESTMDCLAGDLSSPVIGIFSPTTSEVFLVSFPAFVKDWETGLSLKENLSEGVLQVSILFPGVRSHRYSHMNSRDDSPDTGRTLEARSLIDAKVSVLVEPAESVLDLYRLVFENRTTSNASQNRHLPYSKAFELVEEKYNRDSWRDHLDVYSSSSNPLVDGDSNPFQNGWCGGLLAVWALEAEGQGDSIERSALSFHKLVTEGMSPAGLFYGKLTEEGQWKADSWLHANTPERLNWHLVRREGDSLLSSMKVLLRRQKVGLETDSAEIEGLRKNAEALSKIWEMNQDFGQWLDQTTGKVEWTGTASGGAIPAGLALASVYFQEARFLEVAKASLATMEENYLKTGVAYGGVGDALSVPDSESIGALIESAMFVYAATGEERWIQTAEWATQQFATWVMDYDYPFPKDSEFGKLGMTSTGSVFANVQNKHSAPGICTHSGQGIFRLYRATGNTRYLDLIYAIAGSLPQFVSREDRPIHASNGQAMPSGWINERVNTSDWDNNLGGIFYGSCWCEMSLLLSYAELPGIYVDLDSGQYWSMEPIEVIVTYSGVTLKNPTQEFARVKVLMERSADRQLPLPLDSSFGTIVELAANEQQTLVN